MSPIGTMRGRIAASAPSHVEEDIARQPAGAPRRQIERGGGERQRIAGVGKASTSVPSRSAAISVGTNGAEAGMVKTRGGGMVMQNLSVMPAHAGIQSIVRIRIVVGAGIWIIRLRG